MGGGREESCGHAELGTCQPGPFAETQMCVWGGGFRGHVLPTPRPATGALFSCPSTEGHVGALSGWCFSSLKTGPR